LGVSEASALLTELAFLFLLAWGAFRLSRHWLDPPPALAVALLLLGAPELAFWGRHIMLDVPAYAFLVWAAEFLVCNLKSGQKTGPLRSGNLRGRRSLHQIQRHLLRRANRHFAPMCAWLARVSSAHNVASSCAWWSIAAAAGRDLFAFGSYNLDQAAALPGGEASRWSIAELTYYARIMPSVISWPTLAFACLYVLALPFAPALRLPHADAIFLASWLLVGYAFYSTIAVKEPRAHPLHHLSGGACGSAGDRQDTRQVQPSLWGAP